MKSKLCEQGDCRRCGGGIVRGGGICSHSCHKRIGRPALQGPKREAARKRADRVRMVASEVGGEWTVDKYGSDAVRLADGR